MKILNIFKNKNIFIVRKLFFFVFQIKSFTSVKSLKSKPILQVGLRPLITPYNINVFGGIL